MSEWAPRSKRKLKASLANELIYRSGHLIEMLSHLRKGCDRLPTLLLTSLASLVVQENCRPFEHHHAIGARIDMTQLSVLRKRFHMGRRQVQKLGGCVGRHPFIA